MLRLSSAYLPQAHPLPPLPSFLVSLYCCCTNGMAAWHRCAMFHSAAAQPRRLKVPRKVDYAISISICGLIFNIQLSCVCVCGKVKVAQAPFYYANQNG